MPKKESAGSDPQRELKMSNDESTVRMNPGKAL
jgi:hypothetical protein